MNKSHLLGAVCARVITLKLLPSQAVFSNRLDNSPSHSVRGKMAKRTLKPSRWYLGYLFRILVVILANNVSTASAISFTGLGALPGAVPVGTSLSQANGISGDGSVVVGSSSTTTNRSAVIWYSSGEVTQIGPDASFGRGISHDGTVAVGEHDGEAYRWTADAGWTQLGALPGDTRSNGDDVSGDGSVVTGTSYSNSFDDYESFIWTSESGMVGIGVLPGHQSSWAHAISADGTIIAGQSRPSTRSPEAYRWTQDSGIVGLGHLPGDNFSLAHGISADGSTIVGYGRSEAFRWTEEEGMVGLGDLSGGSFESGATDASRDGRVIVGWGSTATGMEASIWDADNGMLSLMDILIAADVDMTGWSLSTAMAISDNGKLITGFGVNPDGLKEAWLINLSNVPIPPALWLFGSGLLGLIGIARRKKAA